MSDKDNRNPRTFAELREAFPPVTIQCGPYHSEAKGQMDLIRFFREDVVLLRTLLAGGSIIIKRDEP